MINRNRIRGLMAEKGLTIQAFAKEAKFSSKAISNFLKGASPSYRMIMAFKKVLELSSEDVMQIFFKDVLLQREKELSAEGK